MSRYAIKDIFLTLQGEGARAGTKAVFCRFTGCNLWDGHPMHRDRGEGSCARWCDTDFFKGTVLSADEIVAKCGDLWPALGDERWVVLTGGEPCLQLDRDLLLAFQQAGWRTAIETNGTEENEAVEFLVDHICIAPKLGRDGQPLDLALRRADEVKVVLPGALPGEAGWTEDMLLSLESNIGKRLPSASPPVFFVQPQDPLVNPALVSETHLVRRAEVEVEYEQEQELKEIFDRNVARCVAHVLRHSRWRISYQVHKAIGVQ